MISYLNLEDKANLVIAGSILDCSIWTLKQKIDSAIQGGMQRLHYDVMDGNYVPRITFGANLLADLKQMFPLLQFDCHFMVQMNADLNLVSYFTPFITAGANLLTVQLDSFASNRQIYQFLQLKKDHHIRLGLAVRKKDSWDRYRRWIRHFDSITVMGVKPGSGGQVFCPSVLQQIAVINQWIKQHHWNKTIQIDGGVKAQEAVKCYQAGARIAVMGSYLFRNHTSPCEIVRDVLRLVHAK